MAPPIVIATIQAAIITTISNVIAQVIAAQQKGVPFNFNPVPTIQFILFALISTPPNFLWQEFLESTWPGHRQHVSPKTTTAQKNNNNNNNNSKNETDSSSNEKPKTAIEAQPKLNKTNTVIKTLLDQTLGAAVNTLLFSMFMGGIKQAMAGAGAGVGAGAGTKTWTGPEAVDWAKVWAGATQEFGGIYAAGLRFWPLVSAVNFVFLKSVEARNLLGNLAGLGWGVYMSLISG